MDNRAGEMTVFVRVVEAGSFSEAARLLKQSASTVSKLVARLEARLGTRLVERSTHHLTLTKEGQLYYERSQALLEQIDQTEQEIAQGGRPEGTVRVSASVSFGTRGLEPLLPAFWKAYPEIVIDLSLSDEIVDLYLDRTDVAFRIGRLQASSLVARKVGVSRAVIVGSPSYFAKHGTPKKPADLAKHNCLGFNFRRAAPVWPLSENGTITQQPATGSLLANNGESVGRMALAGVGLARVAQFAVRDYLARGELVEVLAESAIAYSEEIHAVTLGAQHIPQRLRVFLDFVVPRLQKYLSGPRGAARSG